MKKRSVALEINKIQSRAFGGMLYLSSSFFIALTFSTIMLLNLARSSWNILIVWFLLIFLTSSKFVPENTKIVATKITNTIGSLLFLFLFVSSWLNPHGFLAGIYEAYSKIMQVFLNQIFVVILLTFILIIVFIEALKLILRILGYLFDKLDVNQKLRTAVVTIIVIVSCVVLIVATNKESGFGVFELVPYLVPFSGFSLLYLHTNFLIKELARIFQNKSVAEVKN